MRDRYGAGLIDWDDRQKDRFEPFWPGFLQSRRNLSHVIDDPAGLLISTAHNGRNVSRSLHFTFLNRYGRDASLDTPNVIADCEALTG
jgi:hypothetical protein